MDIGVKIGILLPMFSVTIYDGNSNRHPIIRKVCGLQQRLELFAFGAEMLIEFNTTNPVKTEPRGCIRSGSSGCAKGEMANSENFCLFMQ